MKRRLEGKENHLFGYVKPRVGDLYVKEEKFYRAVYCGVCREMKRKTGFLSSLALSYDFVFLALCRMAVTGEKVCPLQIRCAAHPFKKRTCLCESPSLAYAAALSAILTYEKLKDDFADSGFFRKVLLLPALPLFRHGAKKAGYVPLGRSISVHLASLSAMEKEKTASLDAPADVFGQLLGEIFSAEMPDEVLSPLYETGYHLGKFIYVADAAEDYEKDKKSGNYNPLCLTYSSPALTPAAKESVSNGLYQELSFLAKAMEKLPQNGGIAIEHILKNILYAGLPDRIAFLSENKKGNHL
ncbi:MAG: DUF5685 family protein [Clostridia bacterium]|nr:DUF5685 family protein [Clostridia bacterium]